MFQKISAHIYFSPCEDYSDRPNIGYIKGENGALLFEAGNSAKHAALLRQSLETLGLPQPSFVAVSHWHWDHTFGLHSWDAVTIAGAKTNRALREVALWAWNPQAMEDRVKSGEDIRFCSDMICREYPELSEIRVVPAQLEFSDTLTIDLGGVSCRFFHAGGPHSEDSVVCFVPEDEFLFLGDSNGKDMYGIPWVFDINHEERLVETLSQIPYDIAKTAPYVRFLKTLSFSKCIGGHAGIMTRQELFASLPKEDLPHE